MYKNLILVVILIVGAVSQRQSCLLEEPLTDSCLNSVQVSTLGKDLIPYLCVITSERSLWEKAEQFCKEASKIDLQSGYRYFKALLNNRKFDEAFKMEYNLFFVNPFSHNSQLLAILKAVEPVLHQNQDDISKMSLFQRAVFYFYSNKTEKSHEELKKLLLVNSENIELIYEHFLMGRLLEKLEQYYEGMNYMSKVIKTNKKLHPYLYHLNGNFLMHHVQFQKAIKQFEKANHEFHLLYNSNGFSFSHYNIGLCYEKLGKIEDAVKHYEKSVIGLSSAEGLNALGHAHFSLFELNKDERKLELAETYYKKALQLNEHYTVTIFNLGVLELSRKHIDKAIQYFESCLSMEQKFRSCKYGLIKAYYSNNRTQKASAVLDSVEITEDTLTELLALLYELGDYKKAVELAGEKEDYKSSELCVWKGFNEYSLQLYDKAERSLSRAIFLGAKKAYVYYSLGLAQMQLKKYDECSRSFGNAYKLDPREDTKINLETCKNKMSNDL